MHVLLFTGVPFVLAGWLLFSAIQSLPVKIFAATVVALAGIWNLMRAYTRSMR